MAANDAPLTRSAGRTSSAFFQPTIVMTSQAGRMNEKGGRIRPTIAFSSWMGRPVTPFSTRIGVAHAAPGHRRRVGEQAQRRRLEVREAEADQERAGDRHRRPAAPAALEEGAEAEGDQDDLEAPVRGDAGDRLLHHLELPGLDRDVVEVDRGDDDPGDPEEAEDEAVDARRRRSAAPACRRRPRRATTAITMPQRAETHTRLRSTSSTKKSVTTGSAETSVESGHQPSGS